jgi:hypothetical protein
MMLPMVIEPDVTGVALAVVLFGSVSDEPSNWQVALQLSPGRVLPSSQFSFALDSTTRFPQAGFLMPIVTRAWATAMPSLATKI